MTPEERDRLATVEQILRGQKQALEQIQESVDRLVALANMGRGALGLFLKMGAVMATIVAVAWAVFDKFHKVAP